MQFKQLAPLTFVLLCAISSAFGWDSEYRQGFALSNCVDRSALVVVGRVTQKDFVKRVLDPTIGEEITTDITVEVQQVVKGAPNAGKKLVKFMYQGGQFTDPVTGEPIEVIHTDEPEFTVGEEILLFLYKSDGADYENYPHDKLQVMRGDYGKRLIRDNTIWMLYAMDDDRLKPVVMPLELAIKLAKAADKDKEKVESLENDIKAVMRHHVGDNAPVLSPTLVKRLSKEAQKVINKHSKPKTQSPQTQD